MEEKNHDPSLELKDHEVGPTDRLTEKLQAFADQENIRSLDDTHPTLKVAKKIGEEKPDLREEIGSETGVFRATSTAIERVFQKGK